MRQQVLDALSHALSVRSAPPPALLALEDGLQLIVLLLCFIIWPGPPPSALIIAFTATPCLSLSQSQPDLWPTLTALMPSGAVRCLKKRTLEALGSDKAMAEGHIGEATPYRGSSLLAFLNALIVYECCVICSGRLLWLFVMLQAQA